MSKLVYLNVGGERFQTYQSTLTGRSKYFQAMLEGPWREKDNTEQKPIFIDRDAKNFRHILAYLRDPSHLVPDSAIYELDYFQIDHEFQATPRPTMYQILNNQETEEISDDQPPLQPRKIHTLQTSINVAHPAVHGRISGDLATHHRQHPMNSAITSIKFEKADLGQQDRIQLKPQTDFASDFSLVLDFGEAIDPEDDPVSQYFKYHLLEELCFNVADLRIYRITGVGLFMFDQIHTPANKIIYDQLQELETGEIIYRIPKFFIPHCPMVYFQQISCQLELSHNLNIPSNRADRIKNSQLTYLGTNYSNSDTRKQAYQNKQPFMIPFTVFNYYDYDRSTTSGLVFEYLSHSNGCVEKFYLMVSARANFTRTYPIKSVRLFDQSSHLNLIDHLSERQILDRMAEYNIYPNSFVYLIDFNPASVSTYGSTSCQPHQTNVSPSRFADLRWQIELYDLPQEEVNFHVLTANHNIFMQSDGVMGLRYFY